jgi:hypothetical protein
MSLSSFPYVLFVRSYAPFRRFGFGFHGDGRGPTTADAATSRVWAAIGFDPTTGTSAVLRQESSPTGHAWVANEQVAITTAKVHVRKNGGALQIEVHVSGANPMLAPASPDIDVHLRLSVAVVKGVLALSGSLSGDGFPNTEIFVADKNDARRMLLTFETHHGPNYGPAAVLWGDARRPMNAICDAFGLAPDGTFA